MSYTIEQLTAVGGNEWQKGAYHRVYFNNDLLLRWFGLELSHYNTGNISSASLNGERISNSLGREYAGRFSRAKLYYDIPTSRFMRNGLSDSEVTTILTALRAEIAALTPAAS